MKTFLLCLTILGSAMLLHSVAQKDEKPADVLAPAEEAVALEYKVVSAPSAANVESICKMLIEKGWRPHGGVSVGAMASSVNEGRSYRQELVFCQAMVR